MSCSPQSVQSFAGKIMAIVWLGILMSEYWAVSNEVADGKDKFGASLTTTLAAVNAALWLVIGMNDCLLRQHPWFKYFFIGTNVAYLVISIFFANLWLRDESNFYKTKLGDMTPYGQFHAIAPILIGVGLLIILGKYGLTLYATEAERLQSQMKSQQQQLTQQEELIKLYQSNPPPIPYPSPAVRQSQLGSRQMKKPSKRINFRR